MNEFVLILGIALVAATLTYLGAPVAERFTVSSRAVSGALKFVAGVITALVAFTLMPKAVGGASSYVGVLAAFFVGGLLYLLVEQAMKRALASRSAEGGSPDSVGLYMGILVDMLVDGAIIGIGATLSLATGLVMAVALAAHMAPLTFVTIATAKRQGMAQDRRHLLGFLCFLAIALGVVLGYLVLRNQPLGLRLILVALASGFLITSVVEGMLPEANREGQSATAGALYLGGLTFYALMSFAI